MQTTDTKTNTNTKTNTSKGKNGKSTQPLANLQAVTTPETPVVADEPSDQSLDSAVTGIVAALDGDTISTKSVQSMVEKLQRNRLAWALADALKGKASARYLRAPSRKDLDV